MMPNSSSCHSWPSFKLIQAFTVVHNSTFSDMGAGKANPYCHTIPYVSQNNIQKEFIEKVSEVC